MSVPILLISLLSVAVALIFVVVLNERREDENYLCYRQMVYKNHWKTTYTCEGVNEKKCKRCMYYKQYLKETRK